MSRIKIAQYSFSGCEGCAITLLNTILSSEKLVDKVEIVSSRLAGIVEVKEAEVAFIDGAIMKEDEEELAEEIRRKTKIVVALGTCSTICGINALKELHDQGILEREVYGTKLEIKQLLKAKPLDSIIKVDYIIPGCPPPRSEIEEFLSCIILGKEFRLPDRTVCFECTSQGLPCLLEEGEICFGPIVRGGCKAICIKYGTPCLGCRGLVEELRIEQFKESIKEHNIDIQDLKEAVRFFLLKTKLSKM